MRTGGIFKLWRTKPEEKLQSLEGLKSVKDLKIKENSKLKSVLRNLI